MDVLYIFDPNEIPFGKLSPNHNHKFKAKGEEAFNIISYSYAGLVSNPGIKRYILSSKNPKESKQLSLETFVNDQDHIYKSSFISAMNEKYKIDICRDALLETGLSTLIYVSDNLFLGVDSNGNGENFVGKTLMNIRKRIAKEEKENYQVEIKNLERNIKNTIHQVYEKLKELFLSASSNLEEFLGKSPSDIKRLLNLADLDYEVEMTENIKKLFKNPRGIAHIIRNEYKNDYNKAVLEHNKREILADYMKTVINTEGMTYFEERYPGRDKIGVKESMRADLFSEFDERELLELEDRLYDIWKIDAIKYNGKNLRMEILDDEDLSIPIFDPEVIQLPIFRENLSDEGKFLYIRDDNINSPIHYMLMTIENFLYPTVIHYVRVKMLESFKMSVYQAHSLILKDPSQSSKDFRNYKNIDEMNYDYEYNKQKFMFETLKERSHRAILSLYRENTTLQGLLVSSSPKILLYNDYSDSVLGTGRIDTKSKRIEGHNLIGLQLAELRDDFIREGIQPVELEKPPAIVVEDVLINKNVKEWLYKKLDEILYILRSFKYYSNFKYGGDNMIDSEDVDFILKNIYGKCSRLYKLINVAESKSPQEFDKYVKNFFRDSNNNVQKGAINKLWSYIMLLNQAIEKLENFDINDFEKQVEKFESDFINSKQGRQCKDVFDVSIVENTPENQELLNDIRSKNCVISAFNTILQKLKEYAASMRKEFELTLFDLFFAYEIIYHDSKIPQEIEKDDRYVKYVLNFMKDYNVDPRQAAHIAKVFNHLILDIQDVDIKESYKVLSRVLYFCKLE